MAPKPGDTFGKRYRIKRGLGAGWSGDVFEAELLSDAFGLTAGAAVALKLYKAEAFRQEPNLQQRIEREAGVGTELQHPNLLKVYALETDKSGAEPIQYLAIEFCPGGDLSHFISQRFPFAPQELSQLCLKLSDGLRALHSAGSIHRDLKPQNILLDADGIPKIADFGVVKPSEDVTLTNSAQFLGTIRYSSPEQLFGKTINERSDVYSLGTVFFELLYGDAVYSTNKLFSRLVTAIRKGSPKPPRGAQRFKRAPTEAHLEIETLCQSMLARDSKKRPSAEEVYQQLQARFPSTFLMSRLETACAQAIWKEWEGDADTGYYIWDQYTGRLVARAMAPADIVRFLAAPAISIIKENPAYRAAATATIPAATEYAQLPDAERVWVIDSLIARSQYFIHSDDPRSSFANRVGGWWQQLKLYSTVEQSAELRERLEQQMRNTGLTEDGRLPDGWP